MAECWGWGGRAGPLPPPSLPQGLGATWTGSSLCLRTGSRCPFPPPRGAWPGKFGKTWAQSCLCLSPSRAGLAAASQQALLRSACLHLVTLPRGRIHFPCPLLVSFCLPLALACKTGGGADPLLHRSRGLGLRRAVSPARGGLVWEASGQGNWRAAVAEDEAAPPGWISLGEQEPLLGVSPARHGAVRPPVMRESLLGLLADSPGAPLAALLPEAQGR